MSRTVVHLLVICLISGMTALPAVAVPQPWQEVCEEWLEDHPHDPAWMQACMESIMFWEAHNPTTKVPGDPYRPRVFPYDRTSIPSGSHGGDRASIAQTLQSGETADVLVELDAADLRDDIHTRALEEGLYSLSPALLAEKAAGYAALKAQALAGIQGIVPLRDFVNLPVIFVRLMNKVALDELVDRPEVRSVFENRQYSTSLNQSLPLIEHPAVKAAGEQGAGTTIAVLDTGVDFTRAPFNCTSPGMPPECRVLDTRESAPDDGFPDDNGHGTNVSAIAVSTAESASLIVADVFDGSFATGVAIVDGVEWAIMNQATLNVVAMNMSINGQPRVTHLQDCRRNELAVVLGDALAAGIQPIVSAGNFAVYQGAFDDGIAEPACVPAAVSVGNAYDDDVGSVTFNPVFGSTDWDCTDSTTAEDQIARVLPRPHRSLISLHQVR